MKILRFTAPFKPKGKKYVYIGMWNRYIKNKILLLSLFIPTGCSFYFIAQGVEKRYLPIFLLIACYPIFSIVSYLLRIKQHFQYRSPLDMAMTIFTLMDNGILIEREGHELPELYHWNKFNLCYELKNYLLLYKTDNLLLVFDKTYIPSEELEKIRQFILEHMPKNKKVIYQKSAFF